jgi:restriction system protein
LSELASIIETYSYSIILYVIAIAVLLLLTLIRFKKRRERKIKGLTLARLKSMNPREFEHTMAELLSRLGYKDVKVIGGSGDLGVDIIAKYKDDRVVVQCKRYTSKKVGSPELQMFIGMMVTEYKASKGIYITTSSFTKDAIELARRHRIELWDGNKLIDILMNIS